MSEIALLTIPATFSAPGIDKPMKAKRVIGVELSDARPTIEHGYRASGKISESMFDFGEQTNERIADFYMQTLAREPSERPFFDCHLFAYYALGKAVAVREFDILDYEGPWELPDTEPLRLGSAYTTITAAGDLNHSVLGLDKPNHNLSVIGIQNPMVIAKNADILSVYGAASIQGVMPLSAS